ncbi:MAG: low molecular weight phosphotyrosine protein phosphatase [Burkholderiales bacterium]|nr:low molecular weight phosphotyrosine protein phosphatase [Burkholderiales bacterium]
MKSKEKVSVLFVCMGNICRSPTAEAVFRQRVEAAGLGRTILIDSAGTHGYHIGLPPDERASRAARSRGYDMSGLRARQVEKADFRKFDYILAMDNQNLSILKRIAGPELESKARLFMEFSPDRQEREVPDPYYGGSQGFERVLDMVESASNGLLREILAAR